MTTPAPVSTSAEMPARRSLTPTGLSPFSMLVRQRPSSMAFSLVGGTPDGVGTGIGIVQMPGHDACRVTASR